MFYPHQIRHMLGRVSQVIMDCQTGFGCSIPMPVIASQMYCWDLLLPKTRHPIGPKLGPGRVRLDWLCCFGILHHGARSAEHATLFCCLYCTCTRERIIEHLESWLSWTSYFTVKNTGCLLEAAVGIHTLQSCWRMKRLHSPQANNTHRSTTQIHPLHFSTVNKHALLLWNKNREILVIHIPLQNLHYCIYGTQNKV